MHSQLEHTGGSGRKGLSCGGCARPRVRARARTHRPRKHVRRRTGKQQGTAAQHQQVGTKRTIWSARQCATANTHKQHGTNQVEQPNTGTTNRRPPARAHCEHRKEQTHAHAKASHTWNRHCTAQKKSSLSSAVSGAVGDFSYDAVYDLLDAAFASLAGAAPATITTTTMTRRKLFATLP